MTPNKIEKTKPEFSKSFVYDFKIQRFSFSCLPQYLDEP
jgi:hypothetical protein